jgi:hypothetical protein
MMPLSQPTYQVPPHSGQFAKHYMNQLLRSSASALAGAIRFGEVSGAKPSVNDFANMMMNWRLESAFGGWKPPAIFG